MIEKNSFTVDKEVYIVIIHDKKRLVNGFTPIKDMIYLNQRVKLLAQYDSLITLGLKVRGVKTDCIFYEGSTAIVKKNFPITNKIGDYKIEENKYLVSKPLEMIQNEKITIYDYNQIKSKTFDDEKHTETINKYLGQNTCTLIKGMYPGVGKSTLCKNFDKDALFICPYNKLCQVIRTEQFDSITYCKLFGLVGSDTEMRHVKEHDLDAYKTIVFDEIFLYEPQRLKRISELIRKYPNKKFMATGDCDQRNPVGFNNADYLTSCMNILFPNQVVLHEIKRFNNPADRLKLIKLKEDIFNTALTVADICKKHNLNTITSMSQVKTTINIALFNFRCNMVNNHVHKNILKHTEEFFPGQEIICKKYEKKPAYTINSNYTYKIVKMSKSYIQIKDEVEDKEFTIPSGVLLNNFKLPYALTVDSVQGLSFGETDEITIFDTNTPYVDRKFLWTAITRARKLSNVSVFIHSDEEVYRLTQSRIRQYFNMKVTSYQNQDNKANRVYIKDDFVDEAWIQKQLEGKMHCMFCKKHMELYIDENSNVQSNITVDRKDNSKAHTKANSQICCLKCNITKGNRY